MGGMMAETKMACLGQKPGAGMAVPLSLGNDS